MLKILGLCGFLLSLFGCGLKHKTVSDLKLIKSYEVITHGDFEPSGLTLWDGEFYVVSDKHNAIYRLIFEGDTARFQPHITIDNNGNGKFDFEGITHDDEYFYLASERYFQVLKVSRDGQEVHFLSTNNHVEQAGKKVGLFQVNNAHLEGICLLQDKTVLLTAERQPRGMLEANIKNNRLEVTNAYVSERSFHPKIKNRPLDFSGLSCDQGVYVLERNADMVSQYKKHKGQFHQFRSWHFGHILNLPENQYVDMQYGHAEGLVVDKDMIYVILDNNKSQHTDGRGNDSLFLMLRK